MSFEIKTGIHYLTIPEPSIQLIPSSNVIERNLYLSADDLNQCINHLADEDQIRYRLAYENLVRFFHESFESNLYLNDEIQRLKHSIKYLNEIFPIFHQNHRLAKKEKKIFYEILTNIWQRFDKNIQNEIYCQYQLEEMQNERDVLLKKKVQQEYYQSCEMQIEKLNQDIVDLQQEIEQMRDYKYQLENELVDLENLCSTYLIQLDYFHSTHLRSYLKQFNHLQLERDSILTDIELIKYNLFEHHQEYQILDDYHRESCKYFRSTIHELEQELKQQTNQIKLFFPRQTIQYETENLIEILETKIQEKRVLSIQLERALADLSEKIFQQKQSIIKKERDYQSMQQIEQELNQNLHINSEIHLQLKNERRTIERQLTLKLKQFSSDDRLNRTLVQQSDAFLARKKLEQIRFQTMNDQIEQLIDENLRLKISIDNLIKKVSSEFVMDYQKKINELKQSQESYLQEQCHYEQERTIVETYREQYQRKTQQSSFQLNEILKRMKIQAEIYRENSKVLSNLEEQINREQTISFQSKRIFKNLQKRLTCQEKKRQEMSTQLQIATNNIQHSQCRLKIFNQQFTICQNEFLTEEKSFEKLKDFHHVLYEQNQIYTQKSSILQTRCFYLQQQYQLSTQSLQQMHDQLTKSRHTRSMLSGILVRRMNLCRLLYKKFSKIDQSIVQRDKTIDLLNQSIRLLAKQIKEIRKSNQYLLQRNDQFYLQILKTHQEKLLHQCQTKQRRLQYHQYKENDEDLQKKYSKLITRFIDILYRGMIGHIVLLNIQQECTILLQSYASNTNRNALQQLNTFHHHLCELIDQLKSKTAEKNMFIDYLAFV